MQSATGALHPVHGVILCYKMRPAVYTDIENFFQRGYPVGRQFTIGLILQTNIDWRTQRQLGQQT